MIQKGRSHLNSSSCCSVDSLMFVQTAVPHCGSLVTQAVSPTAAVHPSVPQLLTKFSLVLRFPALPNHPAGLRFRQQLSTTQSCLLSSSTAALCCQVTAVTLHLVHPAGRRPPASSPVHQTVFTGDFNHLWPLAYKQT